MNTTLSRINFENTLTNSEFNSKTEKYLESTDINTLNDSDRNFYEFTKLNVHRVNRIIKTYKVSEELKEIIEAIDHRQTWLILTEAWCGDSAQNLPYIAKMAELNKNINLIIMERDKNLETMDLYLTNGKSRSIPKLIVFDEEGNEKFQWGPRPKEAQELVNSLNKEGLLKAEINENLHFWYAKNRGKNIEQELKELLVNSLEAVN
ncbi:MAG: thioredoxin family protein [Bacteroidetes bacterium]|nr:thioredoxin family protein [Bacteroidota bacterium]